MFGRGMTRERFEQQELVADCRRVLRKFEAALDRLVSSAPASPVSNPLHSIGSGLAAGLVGAMAPKVQVPDAPQG